MKRTILVFGAVLVFVLNAWAALLICSKCGYENTDGGKFCSHCGSTLDAAARTNTPAPDIQGPEAGGGSLPQTNVVQVDPSVIETELKTAEECLKKGDAWMAMFYCGNAMAMNMIARPGKDQSERFLEIRRQCEKKIRSGTSKCPFCNGTGKVQKTMDAVSLDGQVSQHLVSSEDCRVCNASGRIAGGKSLKSIQTDYGTAFKQYAVLRQASKWSPAGNAWIPPELDGKLTYRQIAMIKRTTGSDCPDCLGFGHVTCGKCKGGRRLKCPNKECVRGTVTKKQPSGLTGAPDRISHAKCDVCGGEGMINCPDCSGSGSVTCKTCKGIGKLPPCRDCDGEGLKTCGTCKGTGINKNVTCSVCRGGGAVLCQSCKGNGRDTGTRR